MKKKIKVFENNTPKEVKEIEKLNANISNIRNHVKEIIFGQEDVIDKIIITLLSGGHTLLVGLPGLAKTRLVRSLGTIMGLSRKRIQFTPDLMPTDILGSEILEESTRGKRNFKFIEGPVFSQFLLADEINRASPRTQSALLQAMQERIVTVAGKNYDLPEPFHVLATQNPIEQEGTYPLPEAQLDRFLMQINITYADKDAEKQMLIATTGTSELEPKKLISSKELVTAQKLIRSIPVGDQVIESILTLVTNARPETSKLKLIRDNLSWGPGPRASQSLMIACRARAVMQGRLVPSIDDVKALAEPILKHRMNLNYSAKADGNSLNNIINELVNLLK
jgi:MoxR-like ATPase